MVNLKMQNLAREVLLEIRKYKLKIVTAESCTGGLLSACLTSVPGSSSVFENGFVTYSNQSKVDLLHVPQDILKKYGAVSEEVASLMAIGALGNKKNFLSVSITGIAGPGRTESKPEGLVWFSIVTNKSAYCEKKLFGSIGRDKIRERSTINALKLILRKLPQPNSF